jgi:hypothetical protein
MTSPEPNDPLDALLKDDAYIEDNGFTSRVMAGLPRRRATWLRPTILFGAAAIALALLAWWLPSIDDLLVTDPSGTVSFQLDLGTLLTLGTVAVVMASVILGLLAAIKEE